MTCYRDSFTFYYCHNFYCYNGYLPIWLPWLPHFHRYGSAAPTTQVSASTMLLLWILGNQKARTWHGLQWHNIQVSALLLKSEHARHLGRHDHQYMRIHFLHAAQRICGNVKSKSTPIHHKYILFRYSNSTQSKDKQA
jgi:hypothetical protein